MTTLTASCPVVAVATRAPARARASAAAGVASPKACRAMSSSRVVLSRQLRAGFAAATSARAAAAPRSRGRAALRCQAAVDEAKSSSLADTAYLGVLFGLWYAANIAFNIWNKQVLKAYTFPVTGTFVQFGVGLCIASAMWLFRLKKAPKARARPPP
jgi:solute carrier family 35 protein E1